METVKSFIKILQDVGLLKLSIATVVFLTTFVILRLIFIRVSKRVNINPVRLYIKIILHSINIYIFFLILDHKTLLKIVDKVIPFIIILSFMRIADYLIIDIYLVGHRGFHLTKIMRDIIKAVIMIFLILLLLNSIGISITSLAITSAVLTAIVGFGIQDTLSSIVAGISLNIEKPFKINDWIRIGDIEGKVMQISWRAISIKTTDNTIVYIPNREVVLKEIKNYSTSRSHPAVFIKVGTSYKDYPHKVKSIIYNVAITTRGVLKTPPPQIWVVNYNDFSIDYTLKAYINDYSKHFEIEDELMTKIYYAFKRNNIEIPFPIRTVFRGDVESYNPPKRKISSAMIKDIEIFANLSDKMVAYIKKNAKLLEYGPGEYIIIQGTKGDNFYAIISGNVAVEYEEKPDSIIQVGNLGAGSFFGEIAIITGKERKTHVRSIDHTILLVIDGDTFLHVYKKDNNVKSMVDKRLKISIKKEDKKSQSETIENIKATKDTSKMWLKLKKYLSL